MDVDPKKIWLKYSYWPVPIWRFWSETMDLSTGSQDLRCDQLSMFACQTHKYVDLLRMKSLNDQQYGYVWNWGIPIYQISAMEWG